MNAQPSFSQNVILCHADMHEMKLHGMFMEVDCKQIHENNSELNKRNKKKKTHTQSKYTQEQYFKRRNPIQGHSPSKIPHKKYLNTRALVRSKLLFGFTSMRKEGVEERLENEGPNNDHVMEMKSRPLCAIRWM